MEASTWKGMLAESMRENERYNWTLIAAFSFFSMLAVTNFYKSNSFGILFTACAGITGIAIAYSIGFQYWEVNLVGPEPFVAVESLIDIYLGSNVFVRRVDQLQFAFGNLSIVAAVLAAVVCLILFTHRQLTRRIWDRQDTHVAEVVRSVSMLFSFVLTDIADIAILGKGILSDKDKNCTNVNSNDVLVTIFLLSNPILAEISKLSETKKLRKELNVNMKKLRNEQKIALSNNPNGASNIRTEFREKIRNLNGDSFRALQRQTVKATAQTIVTAYIVFPVLIASIYSDAFTTSEWLYLCVSGILALGWYLIMEFFGFGYRLRWLNGEFTSILPRYCLCCWVLFLVQSNTLNTVDDMCKLDLLLYVYFSYLLFPLLVKIYFGSSHVEEKHLALGINKDTLENQYLWTSLQTDPTYEKINWEYVNGKDLNTFVQEWRFTQSFGVRTEQNLWYMANVYVDLVASSTIIANFDGKVTLFMKEKEEKALLSLDKVLEPFTLSSDFAKLIAHLGDRYKIDSLADAALSSCEKVLEIYGNNNEAVANCHNNKANVYRKQNQTKFNKAIEHYGKTLEIRIQLFGENSPPVADCYKTMANGYRGQSEFDKAMEYYEKALEIYDQTYGENCSDVAQCYNNMAVVYDSQSEFVKAMEYYEKSLEIKIQTDGENSLEVAQCYSKIAIVLTKQSEFVKAIEFYEKALEIFIQLYGDSSPNVIYYYTNMANVYTKQSEFVKAIEYHEKALEISIQIYGKKSSEVALCYINLANVYTIQSEFDRAMEYYEKALEIRIQTYGENSSDVALCYNNMAIVYTKKTEIDKAMEYYEKALEIYGQTYEESNLSTGEALENIGILVEAQGGYGESMESYQQALNVYTKILGPDDPNTARVQRYRIQTVIDSPSE